MESEGAALRKVNGSVDSIFKAVAEIGKTVNEMRLVGQVKGDYWSDKLGKKRKEDGLAAHTVKVDRKDKGDRVTFTIKVRKENDGSEWFSTKAKVSSLFPAVTHIASLTAGSKSRGAWATKKAAIEALGVEEWEDTGE